MDAHVFLAVLAGALLHAGWNALVKGGGDPFLTLSHMAIAGVACALAVIGLVPVPRLEAWPWLMASAAIHTFYRLFLVQAYRAGDLGQVYPIARGAAPLITAVAAAYLVSDVVGPAGYVGIAALGIGVFLLSLKGGSLGTFEPHVVGFALLSSLSTASYSLVDGIGARINGSGPSYAIWMFLINSLAMVALAFYWRGRSVVTTLVAGAWKQALGGTVMSQMSYFIVVWAMTKAPIALVAALRETSVLFAAIISVVVLKEALTRWRVLAATCVLVGVVFLRIG
jgi:drug/metabolite transporter (DMT)-like permease